MKQVQTLGALKGMAPSGTGTVKDEMRRNLIEKLSRGEPLFPGILGYQESVIPGVVNAVLSRHNMILLGLRGQAKSRLLRSLTTLLDPELPAIAGCEIHDDPLRPLCKRCRELVAERGDETPLTWLTPAERYVEKLATPDVTIADIIGDVDPIRAARGGHDLASEHTMHYGLLPRAHRGIFALNELPDLAGRIQVGLFNILQEGDVQIKGYPVRLPLDLCMVFTANPEDYTARGKIITPLKDRIGSEIRTHYPTHAGAGRRDHPTGGVDRARRARADPALRPGGRRGRRLHRPPRQAHRSPQRREPAAVDQRPRERGLERRAARHAASGAARRSPHGGRLRIAAGAHGEVRARVRGRTGGRGDRCRAARPQGRSATPSRSTSGPSTSVLSSPTSRPGPA